jgi:hypothetical protein
VGDGDRRAAKHTSIAQAHEQGLPVKMTSSNGNVLALSIAGKVGVYA